MATAGFQSRLGGERLRYLAAHSDRWLRYRECVNTICRLGPADTLASFVVWGDSHAGAIAPALERAAIGEHQSGFIAMHLGCAPVIYEAGALVGHEECGVSTDSILSMIAARGIRRVILHARWAFYVEGMRYGAEDGPPMIMTPSGRVSDNAAAFERMLRSTLTALRERHVYELVIVASTPEVGVRVPTVLARLAGSGRAAAFKPKLSEFTVRQARTFAILRRVGAEFDARVVFPHTALCNAGACPIERNGRAVFADSDHLSTHGAAVLVPLMADVVRPHGTARVDSIRAK